MTDFVLLISDWYRLNKRDLPWRDTFDPYAIWLSEVILQQTRVDQGMAYYHKFISTFPNIEDLANADEQTVLKMWQGLGYYSRARNLLKTAIQIQQEYAGKFPNTYAELLKLKGIGPYTAAAIASFAFNEQKAVVDGNVYRVLSRFFGIDTPINSSAGQKEFQQLADMLIPKDSAGIYNQAIMEFGALQCTPKNPNCNKCPLLNSCASFVENKISVRPFKQGKTKVRNRYLHYFHMEHADTIAIELRSDNDVWQQLYEFPMVETESEELPEQATSNFQNPRLIYSTKHLLSHQRIYAFFYRAVPVKHEEFKWIPISEFEHYPIHRLMDKYWEYRNKTSD